MLASLIIFTPQPVAVGQAFFVDIDNLPTGSIDLLREETLVFQRLPTDGRTVLFTTAVDLYGTASSSFSFTLKPGDANNYQFEINQSNGNLLLLDQLDLTGDDTFVYLSNNDIIPDLQVSLQNNQVLVTNLHFAAQDLVQAVMQHNQAGVNLGRVLLVNVSAVFNVRANITSPVYPQLEFIVMPMLSGLDSTDNPYNGQLTIIAWNTPTTFPNRTVNLTWTNPFTQPVALLLNVTSDIQGGRTSRFFVIAVGNRTLDLNDSNYPLMRVDFTDLDHQGRTARLNVTFRATTELQPFALPCRLSNADATLYSVGRASGFLARNNIAKIYSYDSALGTALQSAAAAPIGQIQMLKPFEGYFVQLAAPQETSLLLDNCEVETPNLVQARATPSVLGNPAAQVTTHKVNLGWNLFSLPGVVPLSLKEIAPANTRFELFACQQDEVCQRVDVNAVLQPGRVYWIYTVNEFTVSLG